MFGPETAIAIVLPVIGGGIWLLRLEGRVNVNEALLKELKEDVSYIRSRIDRALNGRHE
jgi:hypothetical protein